MYNNDGKDDALGDDMNEVKRILYKNMNRDALETIAIEERVLDRVWMLEHCYRVDKSVGNDYKFPLTEKGKKFIEQLNKRVDE